MSEPFIKVFAGDMRADPKVRALIKVVPHGAYQLIQAWDLAKNGPRYSELRDPFGDPMTPQMFAEMVGVSAKDATQFYSRAVKLDLAELEGSVLVFPSLAKRQANAKTPAQRQKEYRDRQRQERAERNGHRDASVTQDVTPAVTENVTGERNASDASLRASSREPEPESEDIDIPTAVVARDAGQVEDQRTAATLPHQLERILPSTVRLTPSQYQLAADAWNAAPDELRHSLRDVEAGQNPTAVFITVCRRLIAQHPVPDHAAKRAGAVRACRRLYDQAIRDGEAQATAREWLERDYRHDPTIVTEALGAALDLAPGDVPI